MPVKRRPHRLLVATLAVPVIIAVYVASFVSRASALLRPPVAAVLGATVIGSVYASEAWRHAPAPVRVAPLRASAVMALALVVLGAGLPAAPARGADPLALTLDTARGYIGTPYRLGAEQRDLVDCSGLIYRVFADIGELPRIGGRRLRAMGYYRWFASRGLATDTDPVSGDLVVYTTPNHIGIYLGDGKVLSALVSGVKVHDLHGINAEFVAFLKVDYSVGDPEPSDESEGDESEGDEAEGDEVDGDEAEGDEADGATDEADGATDEADRTERDEPANEPRGGDEDRSSEGPRGFAIGTMNLRVGPDPQARIVGWVSRGSTFKVLGSGASPSGALWYEVRARSGKVGRVYARWARMLEP